MPSAHLPLSPISSNAHHQPRIGKPSPLKKQSDYAVVRPLKEAIVAERVPPPAPSASSTKKFNDLKTPKPAKKERKKFLCATPPSILHDTKGKLEYGRGRQLGEGGFARCFLVQNNEGDLFAAKTVAKKSLNSARMKAKFFGEIQVHKTMIHPNIVRFKECFEDQENIYMILELCPNKSLMEMLRRRKRFTEPEARFFLLQLLGALKYMHGKKVIHRDLKLGNIFIDEQMNIKIGDFGLAALLVNEDDRKTTICGTPNYIAPEVLFNGGKGGEGHSYEVDLWGVGVILYAMLVGKPPFQSADVDSIYKKIRQSDFEWPEDYEISGSAKSLVNALLTRDPHARPSLDDIADHTFFKAGYLPSLLPLSALKIEPTWPSTLTRREWRRNYQTVATAAGVGIDEAGRPIDGVGEKAGKSVEIPIMPTLDRHDTSKASSRTRVAIESANVAGREHRSQRRNEINEQDNGGYLLPEVLSPRDGHARMRNLHTIRPMTSRLHALRNAPPKISNFNSLHKDSVSAQNLEDEQPHSEIRLMSKKPIRKTSAPVQMNLSTEITQPTSRRALRLARSHLAEKRAIDASDSGKPMQATWSSAHLLQRETKELRHSPEIAPVEEPRSKDIIKTNAAPSLEPEEKKLEVDALEAKLSKQHITAKHSVLERIVSYPELGSKIGVPMQYTATSGVLESLKPFVRNLTACLSSKLDRISSQPQEYKDALQIHKSGGNKCSFVTKWVDYSNKYGIAYILSDGTCASFYNDSTSLIVDKVGGEEAEFVTYSLVERSSGIQEQMCRSLRLRMETIRRKATNSHGLSQKLSLWMRFGNYMTSSLGMEASWNIAKNDVVCEPTITANFPKGQTNWVTHYARVDKGAMFRFLDGGLQFIFRDHSKLVLTSGARILRVFTKHHNMHVLSLEDAHKLCVEQVGNDFANETQLKEKLAYVLHFVKGWQKMGSLKALMEAGEYGKNVKGGVVVLGEPVLHTA